MTEQEIIELIDDRVDMKTDIIMESDWFQECVTEAVIHYLEKQQWFTIDGHGRRG